jgi:hypothetical protein
MVLAVVGPVGAQGKSMALVAPPALPIKVAQADTVVVGKVTKLEEKLVPAERFTGDTGQYRIAVVKVSETLSGKAGKEVKVAFFPAPGGAVKRLPYPMPALKADQEACLYLTKHPAKDFCTLTNYYGIVDKSNPGFARETAEVKKYAKLLADPNKGLTSKDGEERFTTAAMLIAHYRNPRGRTATTAKTYEVGSEQSKLILRALADADWNPRPGARGVGLDPTGLFFQLGLTDKDGWKADNRLKFNPADAKAWLKANAGKYRVTSYFPVSKADDPEP